MKPPYRYSLLALVLVIIFGGGWATGRYTGPARVEYHDRIVKETVEKQTIEQKVDVTALMKQLQKIMEKRNVSKTVDTEKRPDGTVLTHETTKDLTETKTDTETSNDVVSHVATELKLLRESLKLEEHTKVIITAKPNYRLGLHLGYDFASLWGRGHDFNIVPVRGLVGQLQFERRLFGPVFGVLWLQSTGVAGLGTNLEW